MAITATFNNVADAVTQLIKPLIVKGDSNQIAQPKFSYRIVIKLGSATIYTSNYPFNGLGFILADISKVLEYIFEPDENAAFNLPLSANVLGASSDGGNIKYITVEVSELFAASSTTAPTVGATSTLNKVVLFSLADAPILNIISLVPQSNVDGKFLTNSLRSLPMAIDEFKTLSFFFGSSAYTGGTGTGRFLVVDYFNASGVLLESNNYDFGSLGVNPNSQANANDFIKTFGIGAANLERMADTEWKPSTHSTLSYYECYLVDELDTPTIKSDKIRFNITCESGITIKFVNEFGVWDYYTFRSWNRKEVSQTKETFRSDAGNFQGANYTQKASNRGLTDFNKRNEMSLSVKTGYIDETTRDFLFELFKSPDVRLIENDVEIPINSVSTNYPFDKRKYKSLIEIDFTFKYANEIW